MNRFCLSLFAVAGLAVAAAATDLPFEPIKGYREFSGQMIARPLQMNDMLAKGIAYHVALALQADARARVAPYVVSYHHRTDEYILRVPDTKNEYLLHKELVAGGSFQYVEPDWVIFPMVNPNDALYGNQWHHPNVQANLGWDMFRGNGTVVVAVTDTGVRKTHDDLDDRMVLGFNAVNNLSEANGGQVNDLNGHGTFCAGEVGAEGNNSIGVTGMGWNTKIMPVRISNSSGGSSQISWMTLGQQWAVDNGARVISTSYSGVESSAFQTTGQYITNHNGILCFAAGNAGSTNNNDWPDVTIVGATTSGNVLASFSNRGTATDVVAPGVGIWSTTFGSDTQYQGGWDGTSMACPIAAGIAGVVAASNPDITGAELRTILHGSCNDLGNAGEDTLYGNGKVNLNLALRKAYNEYDFRPTSFQRIRGSNLGGGLAECRTSDNTYARTGAVPVFDSGEPIVHEYQFTSTNLITATLDVTVEIKGGTGTVIHSIDVRNKNTGLWERLDTRTVGTGDTTFTVSAAAAAKYVETSGLVRVRSAVRLNPGTSGQIGRAHV